MQNESGCDILFLAIGKIAVIRVWRSLVSRLNGVQEAAGSNPVTRTNKSRESLDSLLLLYRLSVNQRPLDAIPERLPRSGERVGAYRRTAVPREALHCRWFESSHSDQENRCFRKKAAVFLVYEPFLVAFSDRSGYNNFVSFANHPVIKAAKIAACLDLKPSRA